MKKCNHCGHPNTIRPNLKEDWICVSCNSVIETGKACKTFPVTDGCKAVPPKKVPYDDEEYF